MVYKILTIADVPKQEQVLVQKKDQEKPPEIVLTKVPEGSNQLLILHNKKIEKFTCSRTVMTKKGCI